MKGVWDILPYNMLWNIWLARNRKVFKDKDSTVRSLCNKARSLALETILVKSQRSINVSDLSTEERSFIGYLLERNTSNQMGSAASNRNHNVPPNWKIRVKEEEFDMIWYSRLGWSFFAFIMLISSHSYLLNYSKIYINDSLVIFWYVAFIFFPIWGWQNYIGSMLLIVLFVGSSKCYSDVGYRFVSTRHCGDSLVLFTWAHGSCALWWAHVTKLELDVTHPYTWVTLGETFPPMME